MDKFKSRKFIITILSTIAATATSLIAIDGTVGQICTIISLILPPIIYVVTEGNIDAKAVSMTTVAINSIQDVLGEDCNGKDEDNSN